MYLNYICLAWANWTESAAQIKEVKYKHEKFSRIYWFAFWYSVTWLTYTRYHLRFCTGLMHWQTGPQFIRPTYLNYLNWSQNYWNYFKCSSRLLGEKLSPECVTTTTTTTAAPPPPSTTTFSTTSSTTVRMTTVSGSRTGLENVLNEVKTDSENMFSMELLIGKSIS